MTLSNRHRNARQKAVWGPKGSVATFLILTIGFATSAFAAGPSPHNRQRARPGLPGRHAQHGKLDNELTFRADRRHPDATTSVIVTLKPGAGLPAEFRRFARAGKLNLINGHVVDLPNRLLKRLAANPEIFDVHYNRPIFKDNFRTSLTVGALAARQAYGVTGAGIGVAVIDSGITSWHDDLRNHTTATFPYGDQRVAMFVDFMNGQLLPYDDNGHGSHVAGIIAGNGQDSLGQKSGTAPDASIVSLKVLDSNGVGTISGIISALDWVVANRTTHNIRVVNLSVGAAINESYWTDPLTLAAKRVVDAGIVVVAAAGNMGKNTLGEAQYGGITAPGNAPWVLTVGASSTEGTPARGDDVIAGYSSRGPTFIDYAAKPDLVAPGTGSVSLAAPGSLFYSTKATSLIPGLVSTAFVPYLSLSGTSMSAPVVSGAVALMLQANPSLTPNGVKAILMYTAQQRAGYNGLTEGTGFLNTVGAVRLASFFATAQQGDRIPMQAMWSKHVLWGNQMLSGGVVDPTANAYGLGVNWGVARTDSGENINWGSECADEVCEGSVWGSSQEIGNILWGSHCADPECDDVQWGSISASNIVWGNDCGGDDCESNSEENIVWGAECPPEEQCNILWGDATVGDHTLWSTNGGSPNIIWGANGAQGLNIVWGNDAMDAIVWNGTADDSILWGSDCDGGGCYNVVWGVDASGNSVFGYVSPDGAISEVQLNQLTDGQLLKLMIKMALTPPPDVVTVTTAPPTTVTTPLLHLSVTTTVTTTVRQSLNPATGVRTVTTSVCTVVDTTDTLTLDTTTASSTTTTVATIPAGGL